MTVITDRNFGTVCSSLIALPGPHRPREEMRLLFAPGRPDRVSFSPLSWADSAPTANFENDDRR